MAPDRTRATATSAAASTPDHRLIKLRHRGTCSECGKELLPKTDVVWNRDAHTATCVGCEAPVMPEIPTKIKFSSDRAPLEPARPANSVPGGSAQAEYERRHAKRNARVDEKWGRLAGLVKFLSDDPQSTQAWARGAEGERRLASHMERELGDKAVFLHDRKYGRANLDHLVIASSGIWIVDAKSYTGRVEYRNVGGWLGPADNRIYVGGRDKTRLATSLGWQVEAVQEALGELDVVLHPVLCFVNGENWGVLQKPFRHEGVLVTWAGELVKRIATPGDMELDRLETAATRLRQKLKPAT